MTAVRAAMTAIVLITSPLGGMAQAFAADDDPAACTDQRFNRRIKEQYELADSIRGANRKSANRPTSRRSAWDPRRYHHWRRGRRT